MWGREPTPKTLLSAMKYFAYCRKSTEGEERQALSIPAQIDEITRTFGCDPTVEIVRWFDEKMSAKAPGRPIYAEMIRRVEQGEAQGIVAWHPDRLARNSVDGGWIVHLLDQRVLKDLKFVSYRYEQSPEGMFMLQIMFGQSKYYVDNLSVNVKRGMRKKIEMGWLANLAPIGYLNDRESGTIVIDPERFPLLRQAWERLLTGAYTVSQIRKWLNDECGFRTPKRRKTGGVPISLSSLYRIFNTPFYVGILDWYGEWRPGKHVAMVTLDEYEQARAVLRRPSRPRASKNSFAFTGGLIRCRCGLSVTAEEKTKPSGRSYTYYHCTRRGGGDERCREPAVPLSVLEDSIAAWLRSIQLPGDVERYVIRKLESSGAATQADELARAESLARATEQNERELSALLDLRTRELIGDAEFSEKRKFLKKQELLLRERAAHTNEGKWRLELGRAVILFRKYAADWFRRGSVEEKRLILEAVGSNCVLAGGKLNIQATNLFRRVEKPVDCFRLCSGREDVGTLSEEREKNRKLVELVYRIRDRIGGDLKQAA